MGRSTPGKFAYQVVYRYLHDLIEGAPRSGQLRLPSLRVLARSLRVSLATVQSAYGLLEHEGRVVSVPKRGYFVRAGDDAEGRRGAALPVLLGQGASMPEDLCLEHALHRHERRLTRLSAQYSGSAANVGAERLRAVVAKRYIRSSRHTWRAEDVHLGPDVKAVLATLLAAIGLAGRTALVTSPCCWRLLTVLHDMGVRVLEVPCAASGQVDLAAMARLLLSEPVHAVVLPSCLGMPQGRVLAEDEQRAIAGLLAEHPVWVLENDLDSERCFNTPPMVRLRDLVNPSWLLVLGSLAATVGAEAPYAYVLSRHAEVARAFDRRCFELAPVRQHALACLLAKGEADAHLRRWRGEMQGATGLLCQQLRAHCGQHMAFVEPEGGGAVWIRLADATAVRQAVAALVGSTLQAIPGARFSAQGHHAQWLAVVWLDRQPASLQAALQRLASVLEPGGER